MKEYKIDVTVTKTLIIHAKTNDEALSQAEELITSHLYEPRYRLLIRLLQ